MTSLTTAGEITDFTVADTQTITTIAFGHTFISGDTAATVTVSNVTAITSLDEFTYKSENSCDLLAILN